MIDAIVAELKKGAIKNVVAFPDVSPSIPYVVVKEAPRPELNRTDYLVIPHFAQASKLPLREYARTGCYQLLHNKRLTSAYFGCANLVRATGEVTGIMINDDKTISMERVFYVMDIF